MTNINPIKFGVGNQYFKQNTNEDLTQQTGQENKPEANVHKQVNGGDVLGYMAAQSAAFVQPNAPKTVNVAELIAKYNTPEQQNRIAAFMQDFEADFNEASAIAVDEFGIEEELADNIALEYINATY